MSRSEQFALGMVLIFESVLLLYAYFTGFWFDWTLAHVVGISGAWFVMEDEKRGNNSR